MAAASTDILATLHGTQNELANEYNTHIDVVRELQRTLLTDVLPGVLDELGEDSPEIEERAHEWLSDTESLFRILRRHKFTRTFALQAARDVLVWRLKTIRSDTSSSEESHPSSLTLASYPTFTDQPSKEHELDRVCLLPTRDPLGCPLVLLPASSLSRPEGKLSKANEEKRHAAVSALADNLRYHLVELNAARPSYSQQDVPVLQYTIVLDAQGLSLRTLDVDLLRWFSAEIQPRFPGMVGAVLVTNTSWTQSGVWSVARRLLPRAALARVSFLGTQELIQLLGSHALPKQYGGTLMSSPPTPPPTPPLVLKQTRANTTGTSTPNRTVTPRWTPPPPQTWSNLLRILIRLLWRRWKGTMRWIALLIILVAVGRKVIVQRMLRRR